MQQWLFVVYFSLCAEYTADWTSKMGDDWPDRWKHVSKLLERSGPFAEADFEPGPEVRLLDDCYMHIRHTASLVY